MLWYNEIKAKWTNPANLKLFPPCRRRFGVHHSNHKDVVFFVASVHSRFSHWTTRKPASACVASLTLFALSALFEFFKAEILSPRLFGQIRPISFLHSFFMRLAFSPFYEHGVNSEHRHSHRRRLIVACLYCPPPQNSIHHCRNHTTGLYASCIFQKCCGSFFIRFSCLHPVRLDNDRIPTFCFKKPHLSTFPAQCTNAVPVPLLCSEDEWEPLAKKPSTPSLYTMRAEAYKTCKAEKSPKLFVPVVPVRQCFSRWI